MKKTSILVFSEDKAIISILREHYAILEVKSAGEALKKLEENRIDVLIIDCDMKEVKRFSLYKEVKKSFPDIPIIMLSSTVTVPEAVEAAKLGVSDFLKKPTPPDKLIESVKKNSGREDILYIKLGHDNASQWLLGSGSKVKSFLMKVDASLKDRKNILFVSENGIDVSSLVDLIYTCLAVGGELVAIDMLPYQKESSESIFWTVLQQSLIYASVIYFINIDLVTDKQRKSIIDYIRTKSTGPVRIVASIKEPKVGDGFDEWEIIEIPSLRTREKDIIAILNAYINRYSIKYGKRISGIALDVLNMLTSYSWPGNYREFECVIENAVISCEDETLTFRDIQFGRNMLFEKILSPQMEDLREFKIRVEKNLIDLFYKKTGSKDLTAKLLDIPIVRTLDILPQ